uniref:Autophagy-related protein n=1 Tax=viral metagenome TaxID=1070528 RepID=A0A6C0L0A5_9ZZZZ|tara:strand:- start:11663 stop:12064 length:402 start_codon:yes stop_codon:yes gene_type:complete
MAISTIYRNYYNSRENVCIDSFKSKHSFENRCKESRSITSKYPDRVPVIVEKQEMSDVVDIDKNKFLVPCDLTVGQFVYVIRKRMKMPPEMGIFVFVNNEIPMQSALISSVYEESKDRDGFLYIKYAGENTFG